MTSYPELKLHIDGEWLGAGTRRTHRVINPANGATLGELPLADAADLDRALQAAERGYRLWKRSTSEERGRVLKGAAQLIRQRVEHIARVATLEEGKTLAETRIEANVCANLFEFYAEECRRTYGRVLVRPTGTRSIVVKEPVGPVQPSRRGISLSAIRDANWGRPLPPAARSFSSRPKRPRPRPSKWSVPCWMPGFRQA